jgi:hypothetical protein
MKVSMDAAGCMIAPIDNMAEQALPRLSEIKKKVDTGRELGEVDIRFMSQVTAYAQRSRVLIERHPEWQEFFTEVLRLYGEIVDRAIENVEKAKHR